MLELPVSDLLSLGRFLNSAPNPCARGDVGNYFQ